MHSPGKRDVLEKWSDVLAANIRDLPTEMQHEAHHMVRGYMRHSVRQYAITASSSPPTPHLLPLLHSF